MMEESGRGWEIKEVLYADGIMLVVQSRENLQHIVDECERTCDGMKSSINVGKGQKYWWSERIGG